MGACTDSSSSTTTSDNVTGNGGWFTDNAQDVSPSGGWFSDNSQDAAASTTGVDGALEDTGSGATAKPGIETITLQTAEHGSNLGITADLTFKAPNHAVSFAITANGEPGIHYVLDGLTAPDGKKLVLENWYMGTQPQMCLHCLVRVAASESTHSALVPNTTVVSVMPGEYKFRFYAFKITGSDFNPKFEPAAGAVKTTVTIKRQVGGLPQTGVVDLNLHFTGAGGITAANAKSHPRLTKALEELNQIYSQAGIKVGNITYRDISNQYQVIEGFGGAGNDFEEVASLTSGNPSGINVVFVRELIQSKSPFGSFGVILGIAGGIPGPVSLQGTRRSAVFITTEKPSGFPGAPNKDHMGPTIAHEVGHFLGLFHSSEATIGSQQVHDPLPDTKLNDTTNLMYYESTNGGTKLTEGQGYVLRNNPWVRHPAEEQSQ